MNQTCKQCSAPFEITDKDLAFFDAVSPVFPSATLGVGKKEHLPPPTLCPACRYQERLTWRNERSLYKRTCSATGKPIVSIFSPDKAWPPVYEQKYWWSDAWDPKSYGRDFDFNRPFFEQWGELFQVVPQIAMNNQQSENCEFTNQSQRNKDCYMIFCANDSRDCLHGMWPQFCTNCVDTLYLEKSELCYEMVNGRNCYHCLFSQNLENCSDVLFSRNCIGCKNCFGCINLRNKEYYFLNELCTKENYEQKVAALHLEQSSGIDAARKTTTAFFKDFPRKYYNGANIENCSGDYLLQCKDSHDGFNLRDAENLEHCQDVWRARNCQDMTETVENDFCYSIEGIGLASNSLFCKKLFDLSNAIYCSHTNFCKNLFGCISLRHAQYCILNKQYTKEEYNELVPKIIDHMRKTPLRSSGATEGQAGEWGSHFPSRFSPYGYNETVAQEYFPLTKEEALAQGYTWKEADTEPPQVSKILPASQLPETIADVPDDILNWAIECEATGRPYRIIKQELDFYRQMNLPIPHFHHDERHRRRMALRNPRKLIDRECMKCQKAIQTTYGVDRPEIVYCEECYLQSVS